MTELETLQQQKAELLGKIQQIAENCEGIDNPENAAKVTELNGRQSELLAQKGKLQTNLSALDNELGNIATNIRNLSGSGIEKILEAIKNQRWYFFKNKPKVLMDRDTALLWADLNYFPYRKNNNTNDYYLDSNGSAEADDLIAETNSQKFGDCDSWRIPMHFELWKMIEDKSFPFRGGSDWRIKNICYWCVNYNGHIYGKDLDDYGADGDLKYRNVAVIPCSHALVPKDYENNTSPDNTIYSETEKLQMTLDIFVKNELEPIFDDAEITQLYRQIYIEKPALMKQLAELDEKITELQKNEVRLTANFNYKPLLAKYDVKAIDNSVIQYYEAVLSVTDEIMDILQEYETEQSETVSEFSNIALKLGAKYTNSSHLSDDENNVLKERQKIISERLELNIDDAKRQILLFKKQAEELADEVNQITHGENSITLLAELEQKPRMSFPFLVENLYTAKS